MPVNFLQLREQITKMGVQAKDYNDQHVALRDQAARQLERYAQKGYELCGLVDKALQGNPRLRCAVPTQENITEAADAQPGAPAALLLAADGSQINPSRHDPFPIGLVNVGVYRTAPGQTPREIQETQMIFGDPLFTADGILGEGAVALKRDLYERSIMADLARNQPQPVVALTDGPLELFYEQREGAAYKQAMKEYTASLRELQGLHVAAGGYIDKPASVLVVRLLELTLAPPDDPGGLENARPLKGVLDEHLFSALLQPGQRSAVFAIQSQSASDYPGVLKLHFFYLNAGREGQPALARVEIPAWVAHDQNLLNLLHRTLVNECSVMGSNHYPYCLLRAHEVAIVGMAEKEKIFSLIGVEYLNRGIPLERYSFKQSGKNLLGGRKR